MWSEYRLILDNTFYNLDSLRNYLPLVLAPDNKQIRSIDFQIFSRFTHEDQTLNAKDALHDQNRKFVCTLKLDDAMHVLLLYTALQFWIIVFNIQNNIFYWKTK